MSFSLRDEPEKRLTTRVIPIRMDAYARAGLPQLRRRSPQTPWSHFDDGFKHSLSLPTTDPQVSHGCSDKAYQDCAEFCNPALGNQHRARTPLDEYDADCTGFVINLVSAPLEAVGTNDKRELAGPDAAKALKMT